MILPNTGVWKNIANDLKELWNPLHVTGCPDNKYITKKCPEKFGSISKTGKS